METHNKNITEDYVSLETAKLLKEKGFNEVCRAFWKDWNGQTMLCHCSRSHVFEWCNNSMLEKNYNDNEETNIAAPTLQMTCKWLREVHNICIYCYNTNNRVKQYGKYEAGASWISDDVSVIFYNSAHSLYADTYEQAIEKVLEYCLTNLID